MTNNSVGFQCHWGAQWWHFIKNVLTDSLIALEKHLLVYDSILHVTWRILHITDCTAVDGEFLIFVHQFIINNKIEVNWFDNSAVSYCPFVDLVLICLIVSVISRCLLHVLRQLSTLTVIAPKHDLLKIYLLRYFLSHQWRCCRDKNTKCVCWVNCLISKKLLENWVLEIWII